MNNLSMAVELSLRRSDRMSVVLTVTRLVLRVSSFLLLITLPGQAQTPAPDQKTISLEELQQMALQNNPTFAQATAKRSRLKPKRKNKSCG